MSDEPVTLYETQETGVAVLRLNRPKARNAIGTAMLEEILAHLETARSDDAVRALVVSSTDHMGLSAGADVREDLDKDGHVHRMQLFADVYDQLTAFPKGTVAACHGDVVGGGAEIAVACDIRVGGSNLKMRFPGAALGVPVGPARLVTLCGLGCRQVPPAQLDHGLCRRGSANRPDQPCRPGREDRGGGDRHRRGHRLASAGQRHPPQGDAPRLGRRRRPLAHRGHGPGRVAAHRSRPAPPRLTRADQDVRPVPIDGY